MKVVKCDLVLMRFAVKNPGEAIRLNESSGLFWDKYQWVLRSGF